MRIERADPAILGSCWNAEGKLNSPENPASPGEILACWISGLGDLTPRPADGDLPRDVLPLPVLPVTASSGVDAERPLEIVYLGQAPLAPAGLVQINFRAPGPDWAGRTFTTIRVTAAGRTAFASIYLRGPLSQRPGAAPMEPGDTAVLAGGIASRGHTERGRPERVVSILLPSRFGSAP